MLGRTFRICVDTPGPLRLSRYIAVLIPETCARPVVPNEVTPINIDPHTQSCRFLKGHRVMVQVQSTWFPLIDRNPQTCVPNIFEAKESDFKAQTHRVWRTPTQASQENVQVVP